MPHYLYSVIFFSVLIIALHSSLANQNQYYENPGTSIIEAVPPDSNSNERGDLDLKKDSSETCLETENYLEDPAMENRLLSPEFISLNQVNTPNADPYRRAIYHKGHYYPYSPYMYQVDPPNDSGSRRKEYNDIWYPYTNPNVYTSVPYPNIPPVRTLPPVYARLYGNSLPLEQEWFPSQIRRQRKLHEHDDLIKQLEYDSIMENVLPTMPIPFPRDASDPQSSRIPYLYASFPHGTSDCAIPILLGCTPKITYGNLENHNSIPVPYAHAYTNLLENKVHDHVDISGGHISGEKVAKRE
ncbi:jg3300 [Pararge aegeria aegeria]|uniref:Jg3300 protein n=1 Tax=Pararge aegeria aegeria TaxID=348720 RepID=A0A8S4RWC0_9NEOP|nr:jg3300 [Pararge aegeria aegeria]